MNWFILTAAIFSLLTTIGHFTVGLKEFLKPMLEVQFDAVAQKIMHCVFHYVSAFLILSTVGLFIAGLGKISVVESRWMVLFIAANFILNALWQIVLALLSSIPNALFKMFQCWTVSTTIIFKILTEILTINISFLIQNIF